MTHLRSRVLTGRVGIAAAIVVSTAIGAVLANRAGYGPDEEITFFAVEGISAYGAPILPSGIAYLRGPLFSYLAWLSGLLGGSGFASYRWLGVAGMAAVIAASAMLARTLFGSRGVVVAWLIALSPVAIAGAAYARFYMPFAACCTLTLVAAVRVRERPHLRVWFVIGCLVSRSLHEFGVLLAVVPAAGLLCAESDRERRSMAWLLVVTAAALAAEHSLLLWLPCLSRACEGGSWGLASTGLPAITSTALPVAGLATPAELTVAIGIVGVAALASYLAVGADLVLVVAVAGAAAVFANGVVVALVVLWSIARPHRSGHTVRAGLIALVAGSAAWIAVMHIRSDALIDATFVAGLLRGSVIYPWGGIAFLATQPLLSAVIALGVWRSAFASSAPQPVAARTMVMLLLIELLSFGVVGIDVRSRFLVLLMPLIAVFAGGGVWWLAETASHLTSRRSPLVGRVAGVGIAITAVALIVIGQGSAIIPHRDRNPGAKWWMKWSPPVALSSLDFDRGHVASNAVIVTNDELAALLVLGRVDYWWPPDSTSAERYSFTRQGDAAQPRGIYAGAPVLTDASAVRRLLQYRDGRDVVVALFNTGKFGFDRPALDALIDQDAAVELAEPSDDWVVARFLAHR